MGKVLIDKSLVKDGEGIVLCEAIKVTNKNFDDIVRFASNAIVEHSIVTSELLHKYIDFADDSDIGKECIVITDDYDSRIALFGTYLVKYIGKMFVGDQQLCDDFYDGYISFTESEFNTTFVTPEEFCSNLKIATSNIE